MIDPTTPLLGGEPAPATRPSPADQELGAAHRDHVVIAGARKAGTTSLHALLAQHPQVRAGREKELHYFDLADRPAIDEYRLLFDREGDGKLLLDATPAYLGLPYVPARVAAVVPQARLIAIVREPVARSHSDWWMNVTRGDEHRSFECAIADELEGLGYEDLAADGVKCRQLWSAHLGSVGSGHVNPTFYVTAGLYDRHLTALMRHFDAAQILVLFFEEMVVDTPSSIERICEFLEIDPGPLGRDLPAENTAVGTRTMALRRLRRNRADDAVAAMMPNVAQQAVRHLFTRADTKPPIPAATAALLHDYYREPNLRLAQVLGRPLPW